MDRETAAKPAMAAVPPGEGTGATRFPRRRTDVRVQELDGEALVYDATTADTHLLNATAYAIWQVCDGRRDTGAIATHLSATYDVSAEDAGEHVRRILEEFDERCLLESPDQEPA
ncbi:MAG TPA: HPr-rel-A system PqqD family peptide chaperone [Phycisphaerae bacterium]|nr:HPr-rel-A system PqqD family peptide chaperone [Phycisphaerae bacterium]HNU46790.1 HPr-rel-A system PqqD family peptide chaperone [Phycisphaerae bacterium]